MRKPGFFTFFLLSLSVSLNAQSIKQQNGWAATLTVGLVPISQPGFGIQPGVEYRFNDRLSWLTECTLRANKKDSKDSSELNKQYLRFKSEMRYSLSGKRKKSHAYAGLQASRASRRFINQNGYYYDNRNTDSGYYFSKASINSPVTTISLQFGSVISFSDKRLAMDIFAGVGARFIHTDINDAENTTRSAIAKATDGPSFTPSYTYAGNVTMLHLTAGIRLMWHFYDYRHPQK